MASCPVCQRWNRIGANYCATCGRRIRKSPVRVRPASESLQGARLGPDERYLVQEEIGQGGFGTTYLAEDIHLRRLCLVKRLILHSPEQTTPEKRRWTLESFAREVELLTRLNHPGHASIPEIYEYLPDEQCLVMKYITGENLGYVLKRRSDPLPEAEALRFMRDACAALNYMHTHLSVPVLHGDLKPSNIMLDTTGRVWLIDFGLARHIAMRPSSLPAPDALVGSSGFTAPEQWRGQPEPRSDIFSLGATLYTLLTGQNPPPVNARDAVAIRGVRPDVERLIQRCMAYHAQQRPDAGELLVSLDELLAAADVPPPPEPARPPRTAMVLGRDADLLALAERLHTQRFVALLGMPGVGKTTLAAMLANAHPNPAAVFWHHFHSGEGVDLLLTRLAAWLAHRGHPGIWQQLQRKHQAGNTIASEVIADAIALSPAMQAGLLCLDDLHVVADHPMLHLVLERLRAAGASGPAIMVTTRTLPGFLAPSDGYRVQGLQPPDSQALLVYSGLSLDAALAARLWSVTEGNPQFLRLAIEALRQAADPEQLLEHICTADQIGDYLLREVDAHLSDAERDVMIAVAVFLGYGGTRSAIEAVLDGAGVRRELAALIGRQLLMVDQPDHDAVYHQHALVQSFYYDLPGMRALRTYHARAGAHYANRERDRIRAARHFLHADVPLQAAQQLVSAPWELLNQGQAGNLDALAAAIPAETLPLDLRVALWTVRGEAAVLLGKRAEARGLFEQALAANTNEPPVRRARRYRLLAQLYEQQSEYAQAEQYCRRGLELADQPDGSTARTEQARLYAQLAEILMRRDDDAGALDACLSGLAILPPEPAAPAERAELLQRIATLKGIAGEYGAAITALEQSLEVARITGDHALIGRVLHNLGHFCYHSGRLDEALPYLHESRRIKAQIGDDASAVDTINTLGLVHLSRGDHQTALECYQQAYQLAERYHQHTSMALVLHNIGEAHYEAGDLEVATEQLRRASALLAELGETGEQIHCLYLLGDVALARHDAAGALAYGQQALDLAQQTARQPLELCALRVIGEARLAQSDLAAAEVALTRAWELAEAIADPYDLALVLAARARLAHACGNDQQARQDASQSLELAQRMHIGFLETAMQQFVRQVAMAQEV